MTKKPSAAKKKPVELSDYRHEESRTNIPLVGISSEGNIPNEPKMKFSYSPRNNPTIRFDETGDTDSVFDILKSSKTRKLSSDEIKILEVALGTHEPWLEWAGKRESKFFEVDPVALHFHESVSAQAILKIAARQDVNRDLFGDPMLEYQKAVQFYEHQIGWTNRLILGDSAQVMTSLAHREDLLGKVQMIYFDPPYGIRFGSNFQVDVKNRDTKDQESHLTREPEMVKAYRDTWSLGIHSYLTYLRDRLIISRELLKDSGSIFVQIGDENLHYVSMILDEVFGSSNRVQIIAVKKKSSTQQGQSVVDYLLWYAKHKPDFKMLDLYRDPGIPEDSTNYRFIEFPSGERKPVKFCTEKEKSDYAQFYMRDNYPVVSQHYSESRSKPITVEGKEVNCGSNAQWRFDLETGMKRLEKANRLRAAKTSAGGVVYWGDSRLAAYPNVWTEFHGEANPVYVVQTNRKVVERCMLMCTEPGDLVLDPTCGSGTTAYVSEQWGRRWITIDTSRIAISITRQRLLTAKFDYFELKDNSIGISGGFRNNTVEHITHKSIANNQNLDPIFEKHDQILDDKLKACNIALESVPKETRFTLQGKLLEKKKIEGRLSITDADTRRWELPEVGSKFEHWNVPFDTDSDWPDFLSEAVNSYRVAWREKMDEVNECIRINAEQKELIDQPIKKSGVLRVSGPFSVEAVQPVELSLIEEKSSEPEKSDSDKIDRDGKLDEDSSKSDNQEELQNLNAYIHQMISHLQSDGVCFPDNKQMKFTQLEATTGNGNAIHAEGRWMEIGNEVEKTDEKSDVAVAFGPQYGPVTAMQVEELIRSAARGGYDILVIAGFNFDGAAQAIIDESAHPKIEIHMAHIRPDINPGMRGLLKEQPGSQLFSVFGQPRTSIVGPDKNNEYVVKMEGVDIYDPVSNTVNSSRADKIAAWFLDSDYDGRTFCTTQAFFPNKKAWKHLAVSLKNVIDDEVFKKLSGNVSLPFPSGQFRKVAVKVIDPRGNEVMRIHKLDE